MAYDATEIEYFVIDEFQFECGVKQDTQLAYRSFNPGAKRIAVIPTCFGQRINDVMNFTNGALKEFHVVVVGMFGGGESSSPSNDASFPPDVRYEDCVRAQYALVTTKFGRKSIDLVLGSSMGAQQAYYWATMYGSDATPFVKQAVAIVGSARTSGHCYAFLEGCLQALLCASDYNPSVGCKPIALRAFGAAFCPWTTSPTWYRQELWKNSGFDTIHEYLSYRSKTAFLSWDAQDIISLIRMWQNGNIAHAHPSTELSTSLSQIETEMLIIPCRSDQYFVHSDCTEEARLLRNGRVASFDSLWGHVAGAGPCEADALFLDQVVADFVL